MSDGKRKLEEGRELARARADGGERGSGGGDGAWRGWQC